MVSAVPHPKSVAQTLLSVASSSVLVSLPFRLCVNSVTKSALIPRLRFSVISVLFLSELCD